MSKILITGNGFDLFHHLPTKYCHFMTIMKTIENLGAKEELFFEDLFGKYFKDAFVSDYESIVENFNIEDVKFDNIKITKLATLLKANKWYSHFKTVMEIDTWIDFEIEVEDILNQLIVFNKFGDKTKIKDNYFDDLLMKDTYFEVFEVVSFFGEKNYKLNIKYINKRKNSIDIKRIIMDLADSFEDFIIIFNRYLVDIACVFYKEIKKKQMIPFHLINEIYTFNYTPTLEKVYNIDKSKVIYLHGEIDEDNKRQNLVLGVSEITQDCRATKVYDFAKYYQKIRKNSNNKFIEIPSRNTSTHNETIFYIIGHSLDESDKEYILDLFKFLEFDSSRYSKICVFHHNAYDREQKIKNLLNIIDKNVIIEMNKCGRLYFVVLNKENIDFEFNRNTYKYEMYIR